MRSANEIIHHQILQHQMLQDLHQEPKRRAEEGAAAREHPPICISRKLGAGARVVALRISERLGYTLFGRDIIDEIAKDLNVQRLLVDSLDESSRNDLEVIMATFLQGRQIEDLGYKRSLFRVVQALASQGGIVFLGRGAGCILREHSALNVLLIADMEMRVRRVMEYDGRGESEARKKIKTFDENRERFHQKLIHRRTGEPCTFDLCIDTTRIEPEQAAELVLQALELRGYDLERMKVPATAE